MTDADLVLGRIPSDAAFPGLDRLDVDAARAALARCGADAEGVVAVVDVAMEQAVRAVTVERGVDPRSLALVAFGGAGPLHACAIADALGMQAVVVPPRAGVLSAVGLLAAPRQRDLVRTWRGDVDDVRALADDARRAVGGGDASVETALDCRYAGQTHALTVASVEAFHDEHRRRNGWARAGWPVEVTAIRARARRPAPLSIDALPATDAVSSRRPAVGPCVLAEPDCTVWVPDGWRADVGEGGTWILRRSRS